MTSETSPPNKADPNAWNTEAVDFTIEYWELSDSEQSDFKALKEAIKDVDHWKNKPDVVVRFLRARPGNVEKAEQLFREMIQWRLDNNVDTILQDYDPPALLRKSTPGAILRGVDKEGDPIYVSRLGMTDGNGLLAKYGEDEIVRYAIWIRELCSRGIWMDRYEKEQGRPVKRLTIIEDLEGLSILPTSAELSLYGKIMRLDQDNYCETAKKLVIIRAPFVFRAVWALTKHFFDAGVVEKMVFAGSDYKDILSKYIDGEVLPVEILAEVGKGDVAEEMTYNFVGGKIALDRRDGEF